MRKVTDLWPNEVIHCPTEAEAIAICKLMHEAGLRTHYALTRYNLHKESTCYKPAQGQYCAKERYEERNHTIYPASDFLEEELKEGDIVHVGGTMDEVQKMGYERIFLYKTRHWQYVTINSGDENQYQEKMMFDAVARPYAVKKSDIKRERKLMMTDAEREKFQKDNNL